MTVKRFEFTHLGKDAYAMLADDEGEFVRYDDYAALQAHVNALAAENAELKKEFEKPQAYLSWHAIPPTWSDPGGGGEYLAVHDDPGHKNDDGSECWPVFPKPELETPSTDAAIRELQAQGVELSSNELKDLAERSEPKIAEYIHTCALYLMLVAKQLSNGEVE